MGFLYSPTKASLSIASIAQSRSLSISICVMAVKFLLARVDTVNMFLVSVSDVALGPTLGISVTVLG